MLLPTKMRLILEIWRYLRWEFVGVDDVVPWVAFGVALAVLHGEIFARENQEVHVTLIITEEDSVFLRVQIGPGYPLQTLGGVLDWFDREHALKL